jgi:hypothetical protein
MILIELTCPFYLFASSSWHTNDQLRSQAEHERFHLSNSVSTGSSWISSARSFLVGHESTISDSETKFRPAFEKAYYSTKVYDSFLADNWLENNYYRWHTILAKADFELEPDADSTFRPLTAATGSHVAGPVACMLAYNNAALCLFGDASSDIIVGMARELADVSAFPVIIRPFENYPSELA